MGRYKINQLKVKNIILETERLILKSWQTQDLKDLNEYASNEIVGQMAGWKPHLSMADSERVLFNYINNDNVFAINLKSVSKVIGSVSIEKIYTNHLGEKFRNLSGREVGYSLSEDFWGQGLMPEAVLEVVDYLFLEYNYDYLMCAHFENNDQSKSVIEKTGFEFVKKIDYPTFEKPGAKALLYVRFNDKREGDK